MYDSDEASETTVLTSGIPQPRYAFESSISRRRKRRVRQFQCCICAIFLSIITMAIIISVAYNIREEQNHFDNGTSDGNTTFFILAQIIPLEGVTNNGTSNITADEYLSAINYGKDALNEKEIIEQYTPELELTSPSYKHQKIVATSSRGLALGRMGYIEEYGSKLLQRKFNLEAPVCYNGTLDPLFALICNKTRPVCKPNKYRSYDGSCNNLKLPSAGVSYQPFRRILKPQYADGVSSPRVSMDGNALPSARKVSRIVHRPIYKDDPNFTVMLAVFGQFLDHDITATALNQGLNAQSIACCTEDHNNMHPECFPVYIDSEDPFYRDYNVTCMEFVRSLPAPTCCFGQRQQLNQASSYIDASMVYGEKNVSKTLRTNSDGLLKMFFAKDNRTLLPISEDPKDGCNREEETAKGRYCFATGDTRANENLHLTSMHLLWARQHNHLAAQLKAMNPNWSDERLFEESRKLLIAQLQHIAYNEFLPILFGKRIIDMFRLSSSDSGYSTDYDENVDASAANGFVASAFRFAHTLIPNLMKMIGPDAENMKNVDYVELHKMLLDPFRLYDVGNMDRALRGAMQTNIQANDVYFSKDLKQRMFESPSLASVKIKKDGKMCGLDLVSLNIQRGRDHGLPGYATWREHCGLMRPRSFEQLSGHVGDDSLAQIRAIYKYVDDIDFYTGSLSEIPLESGFLGPTVTCILVDQFVRLKRGDRFWYENPGQFSSKQLAEIRKTTLAKIICDNSDDVQNVQMHVMKKSDDATNPILKCSEVPWPDLRFWQELPKVPIDADGVNVVIN